jgi:hypothetical protein
MLKIETSRFSKIMVTNSKTEQWHSAEDQICIFSRDQVLLYVVAWRKRKCWIQHSYIHLYKFSDFINDIYMKGIVNAYSRLDVAS